MGFGYLREDNISRAGRRAKQPQERARTACNFSISRQDDGQVTGGHGVSAAIAQAGGKSKQRPGVGRLGEFRQGEHEALDTSGESDSRFEN